MNKREQQQFAAFFEQLYQTEELLDFIKVQLCQSQGYNPLLLFRLISHGQSTISIPRLRQYLSDKAACNERELYQIFQRFDWSRQGEISRSDFLNELTPFGREGEAVGSETGTVTAEAEGHLISLFIEILKRCRVLEVARKQIRYVQPYDAFSHIDHLRTGCIGIGELRKLFYDNDFNVTDRQLYYLLHGLRRRCYRDVNLQVFCENLNPLQFGEYTAYRDKMEQEKEQEYLQRSQYQQQTMRRSRLQAQRIEHQFQKGERKKQAELQRHLQLEQRVGAEVFKHEQENQRQIRRALLQQDREIRYGVAAGGEAALLRDQIYAAEDSLQNQYLSNIRMREEQANAFLTNSALKREQQLQRSRRTVDRERDLLYRQEIQRERAMMRNAAVARQLQISRRRIEEESRRRYEDAVIEDNSRRAADSKAYEIQALRRRDQQNRQRYEIELSRRKQQERAYEKALEASRKQLEESRRKQVGESLRLEQLRRRAFEESGRDRIHLELQLQRQRAREEIAVLRANRIPEYQKELQRTRYDAVRSRGEMSASNW